MSSFACAFKQQGKNSGTQFEKQLSKHSTPKGNSNKSNVKFVENSFSIFT
jgi:hypothetical protein